MLLTEYSTKESTLMELPGTESEDEPWYFVQTRVPTRATRLTAKRMLKTMIAVLILLTAEAPFKNYGKRKRPGRDNKCYAKSAAIITKKRCDQGRLTHIEFIFWYIIAHSEGFRKCFHKKVKKLYFTEASRARTNALGL